MRKEGTSLDRLIKRMAEDIEYLFRHLPVAPWFCGHYATVHRHFVKRRGFMGYLVPDSGAGRKTVIRGEHSLGVLNTCDSSNREMSK
jgi:hypothetical protein